MNTYEFLRKMVNPMDCGQNIQTGAFAVCSSHHYVLESTIEFARATGIGVIVESTSNQVNQFGGYTGLNPWGYRRYIESLAGGAGFDSGRLLLGGDHLGPFPWRSLPAADAMNLASSLVREYAAAGFLKLHLDATMRAADDPATGDSRLDPEIVAERTAQLCRAAEEAAQSNQPGAPAPLYVIGSDVPLPGGTQTGSAPPELTTNDALAESFSLCRDAFSRAGVADAFDRVVAVVVQPGVEHGPATVHRYNPERCAALTAGLGQLGGRVFEAHATDYQTEAALRQMVEDGFRILKVGPSLTYAMREAIFLLAHMENILGLYHRAIVSSRVAEALDAAMTRNPAHWQAYYSGSETEVAFMRLYALSDRCRYYWQDPIVREELSRLMSNLKRFPIPLTLISEFFPGQYPEVRDGIVRADPEELIRGRIRAVLRIYGNAVLQNSTSGAAA